MAHVPARMVGVPMRNMYSWCRVSPAAFVFGWDVGWRVKMPYVKTAIANACSGGWNANHESVKGPLERTVTRVNIAVNYMRKNQFPERFAKISR